MIPNFIRLHNASHNSVVIVNINNIVCIDTDENEYNRIVSEIVLSDASDLENFYVNESPEKIYDMIEKLRETSK